MGNKKKGLQTHVPLREKRKDAILRNKYYVFRPSQQGKAGGKGEEMGKFSSIIDVPIKAKEKDILNVAVHVKALEKFLRRADTPLTVAIQGEWGSGKTSFMNQIHEGLCGENGEFIGIWTHAWEYAIWGNPKDILMNMMQGIITDIEREAKAFGNSLDMSEAFHMVRSMFFHVARIGAQAAAAQLGATTAAETLFREEEKGSTIKVLNDALSKAVEQSLKVAKGKKGFIFFIDDLDRLDPVVAVQFLELIKNIFELEHCIFVLAIDYDVVVKGLKPKFGARTEENDREFRSFFDKIIQVPFSIPISSYDLEKYIGNSLKEIDFFQSNELQKKLKLGDASFIPGVSGNVVPVSKLIAAITNYSTGANPRAIKRMLNTLSLIDIIQEELREEKKKSLLQEVETEFGLYEKLVCFCLVSLQIAYPAFYNLLLSKPMFIGWDEEFARKRGYRVLTKEEKTSLTEYEEFDEDWERFIFRACQSSSYLKARSNSISSIFNILRGVILSTAQKAPAEGDSEDDLQKQEEEIIEKAIRNGLGMASVTGLKSSEDQEEKNTYTRIRYESLEDFEKTVEGNLSESFHLFLDVKKRFDEKFQEGFIKYEYSKNKIAVKIANNKTYNTNIVKIVLRTNGKLKIVDFDDKVYTLDRSSTEISDQKWDKYIRYFNEYSENDVELPSAPESDAEASPAQQ